MYQIVANMPEDVPFTCRVCKPSIGPGSMHDPTAMSPWKKMISNELNKGLQNAIEAAQNSCGYGVLRSLDQVSDNWIRLILMVVRHVVLHSPASMNVKHPQTIISE